MAHDRTHVRMFRFPEHPRIFTQLLECLDHVGCPPAKIDLVVLSHEHLDHVGAAYHFAGRSIIAAHRLAANKTMLRDDFSMLRKIVKDMRIAVEKSELLTYSELNARLHGSIRDIDQWAEGFQALAGSVGPSHAWVHAESFGGEVRVAGMTVRSDDLIHADRHGAIVIPTDVAAKLPEACELCARRETPILEIARSKEFSLEKLKDALKRSAEIH